MRQSLNFSTRMHLEINNLLPAYFDESRKTESEIWGKNLRLEKSEFIKIVAPSGSGKTSIMHFLYGLRKDYNGDILYDGKNIKAFSIEDFSGYRKDSISIVFQDLRLFLEQTVYENLDIKRQLNPFHQQEKISEMAERLGIKDKLQSQVKTCSYGEQQRVSIIRSLMQPFDFLLLDEPFSHLDNVNAQKAMELMIEEAEARKAAIIFADLERIDYFPFTRIYHL
ncbi:MAG TPA: ATP-binding cassette domain-containing protein [Flavisolibacter sp.]|nr:ATP-binding cassette domain-containing protein [Flavisolibacter sp.]